MYKLLLVDDEQLELEALRDFTDWNSMSVEVVSTARNGIDALEKISIFKPQIVLTDVKMPAMDGIELLKNINKLHPNTVTIFLSGYDDFKYVKAALDNGVVGYILKPIDQIDLKDSVDKAIASYENIKLQNQYQQIYKEKFFRELIFSSSIDILAKIVIPLELNHSLKSGSYRIALINADNSFLDKYYLKSNVSINSIFILVKDFLDTQCSSHFLLKINDETICLIFDTNLDSSVDIDKLYDILINKLINDFDISVTIVQNPQSVTLEEIPSVYTSLSKGIKKKFYLGVGKIINSECLLLKGSELETNYEFPYKNLLNSICTGSKCEIYKYIDDYMSYCIKHQLPKHTTALLTYNLIEKLYSNIITNDNELKRDIDSFYLSWNNFIQFDTIYEMFAYMNNIIYKITDHFLYGHEDTNAESVSKILKILEKSYSKNIAVADIAKEVYLSTNYVRTIFKEKMGVTLHEYLTNLRIEKAVELLKNDSLKVQDVSLKVGYEKISHFCSVFSKVKGMTPNEYRKKFL